MRPEKLLGLLAVLLSGAFAQAPPDIAEILQKVSDTYKGVSQYELVLDQTEPPRRNNPPERTHVRVAFKAPNQYRMEGTGSGSAGDDPILEEMIIVDNGSTLWFYLPRSNQYGSLSADEAAADIEWSAHTPEATDRVAVEKYREAAQYSNGAKLLREEEIEFAGAKVSCYVISVPEKAPGPYTWWVDKHSYRVLREASANGTTEYTSVSLGEPLPDSLFQFVPPPGAQKLD